MLNNKIKVSRPSSIKQLTLTFSPRRQPIMELEQELNSDIGAISVETDLGKLSLDKSLVHQKSYVEMGLEGYSC